MTIKLLRRGGVLAALLLAGLAAQAALKEGALAPPFSTQAARAGQALPYSLQEQLARGPVVVYFYPSAFTGGCNLQARGFADRLEQFAAAGASVVGVSLDSLARLKDFSADADTCAGKLTVASDADGRIARAYELAVREAQPGRKDTRGAEIDHGYAERTTFVVGRDGRIAAAIGGVTPVENVELALAAVRKLAAR